MNQAACRGRRRLRRAVGTPPRGRSGKMGMGRERKGVKTRKEAEEREEGRDHRKKQWNRKFVVKEDE